MNAKLTDDQKLLVINLVITLFIKPSNTFYSGKIKKIQRWWRKRSGYYCFTPLSNKTIKGLLDKYYMNSSEIHNYTHPPILKRSMNCCGGRCLSYQQNSKLEILNKAHKMFNRTIRKKIRESPMKCTIPMPITCICNNYQNESTLENLWRIRDDLDLMLYHTFNYRRKWKRMHRNSIYLILAKDEISWFTRNTIINFLKTKKIIK